MPKPIIHNIHDNFVKQLLSNKDTAEAFLREYLPEEIVADLNFETMEYQNTSYLSKQLQASYSDMVWRIETIHSQTVRVCLLLEHKSYVDSNVAFQMLEYIALGYQTQLKNKKELELIIPLLYYHGQDKFEFKSLKEHFVSLSETFQSYVPDYETLFINLNDLSQEQIFALKNGLLRAALLLQQNYFNPEKLNNSIKNILESLNPYLDLNPTEFIFVYMIANAKLNKVTLEASLKVLPPSISDKVMSIYEELIQEGIEKGIEKGREEGIEKGIEKGREEGREEGIKKGREEEREEGLKKTVLNTFDNGLDRNLIRVITGETLEKIEEILRKNGRI